MRQHSSPSTSMIIATMMHPLNECKDAHAEEMIQLALMSRRDYAQWHSYELHIATQHVDWGIAENAVGLLYIYCIAYFSEKEKQSHRSNQTF